MKSKGESITFYSVQKRTGASKSYLYGNSEIKDFISKCRAESIEVVKPENHAAKIRILNMKIRQLEKELQQYKEDGGGALKEKYEKVLKENKELKKQLKTLYKF